MVVSPMTLKTIYQEMKDALKEAGVETPALDARIIIEERAGLDWSDIVAKGDEIEISDGLCEQMRRDVSERINGKPLSRIYNRREFWGMDFALCPDTLDPRPDTELIIELALKRFEGRKPPERILDLGTGSGCILISLLSEFPEARGVGIDLSEGALEMAQYNAGQNGCLGRVEFMHGSWWDALYTVLPSFNDESVQSLRRLRAAARGLNAPYTHSDSIDQNRCDAQNGAAKTVHNAQHKFDLIVSNPPYIANQVIPTLSDEVKNHDPILGLDGGADGLDAYKIILSRLNEHLSEHGITLLEIGYDQENDVMRLSKESRFALRTVHNDLAGNPRVVDISRGDK